MIIIYCNIFITFMQEFPDYKYPKGQFAKQVLSIE
jgi:hypothetical protein